MFDKKSFLVITFGKKKRSKIVKKIWPAYLFVDIILCFMFHLYKTKNFPCHVEFRIHAREFANRRMQTINASD